MLSKYSVRKPYTVVVGVILVIVLGVISFQNMTTDLLPSMNLPYVVVYTTYVGATPEQVENDVTRPLESTFATLTDIREITSSSRDNVSIVVMEFNEGANMDTALIEISSKVDQVAGSWDDGIGTPVAMKINPDMLPVTILSVTRDDMDIIELSDYVENELVPEFEAINGVASATASGVIEQTLDVTIEQSRIDVLNSAILKEVDAELAEVEQQLNDAQAQLSDGKRQLARAKSSTYAQIDNALAAIDQGAESIEPAIEELTVQRAELAAQREALSATVAQLDGLVNMTDEEKAQLQQLEQQLAGLRQQKQTLEQQLANAEGADYSALIQQRNEALAQREELVAQRDETQQYLDDLTLLDADALASAIAQLERDISATESEVATAAGNLDALKTQREATQKRIDDLNAQIEAAQGATGAPADTPSPSGSIPADTDTPSPSGSVPADTDTPSPSGSIPADTDTPSPSGSVPADTDTPSPSGSVPADTDTPSPSGSVSAETTPAAGGVSGTPAPSGMGESITASAPESAVPSESEAAGSQGAWLAYGVALADEPTVEDLQRQLAEAQAQLAGQDEEIAAANDKLSALNDLLDDQNRDLASKKRALEALTGNEADIQGRIEEAQRQIESLNGRIVTLDGEIEDLSAQIAAGDSEALDGLKQNIAALDQSIQSIENSDAYKALQMIADPDSLNAQYAEAQAGLAQMDAGLAQMDDTLAKLKQGIIPGGYIEGIDEDTQLSDARAQLESARSQARTGFAEAEKQLADADAELASARSEFIEQRDEALKNAGLDGVITTEMIAGLIGAQNFAMPAGYVYDVESEQVLVRVGDEFGSLDELKQMKLFDLGLDSIDEVRLLDVASVEIVDNRDEVFTKFNGSDGILLSLEKQSTYSTAEVARTVLDRAAELEAEDAGLHIVDLMNQGEYIDVIVNSVLDNLLSGGVLAILILFLFLMDIRPTITVAFSIPISVVIAFVCMYFSGITLNVLSLSGLSLGIGMLVDNSIVAIENIYRLHDEEHMPLLKSCVVGVQKVAGALFSSTLTTICVFLPIVFVQGLARDLFADIGLTIAYSLLASLLVAMTLVPAMCSFLMKNSKPRRHFIFSRIQSGYGWLLRGALRFKPLVLVAALALLAFSAMQIPHMGISFMPQVDSRQMSATLALDAEASTDAQRAQAMNIMNDMMAVEGVESVGLMGSGSSSILSGGDGGSMSYYIIVSEDSERRNEDIAAEISAIADRYQAELDVQSSTMDISMLTGSGISVEIMGDDIETLQSIALDVADLARQVEGVVNVDDGMEESVPELRVVVDKEKAIDEGLTVAQVYQFIATKLYGPMEVTQVTLDGKSLSLNLIDGQNSQLRPEDIENLEIEVSGDGEDKMVRIGDIAQISDSTSLSTINRASQNRMMTVSFEIADGYSANLVSRDFEALLADYQIPDGYSAAMAGENETVLGIMDDLVWMIVIAIVLIFLIMVAQFQSFKSPIIVMFTIPLAFTGGMLALLMTGMDLSIVSMLGFLILAGVVVNNGIVFIDCVNQLRIEGMEKREALLEAGRQRLRPILMTALTTLLGMSTMALGQGMGAEMMQPMAVVSIGGLTYSTLMTLFVVPVLYDIFNGKKLKAREIQMIREAAGLNGDEVINGEAPVSAPQPGAGTEAPAAPETAETPAAPQSAESPKTPENPTAPQSPESPKAPETPAAAPQTSPAQAKKAVRIRFKPHG